MALTTTRELRWDAPGAAVLNGVAGSARTLVRDFLEEAGWTVVWQDAGAQKVVLRNSLMHGGSGCYVRILDDGSFTGGARVARFDVYESMTDIDTGTGHASGGYLWKARIADSAPRTWTAHADERTFYLTTYVGEGTIGTGSFAAANCCAVGAGDYVPSIAGDPAVFGAFATQESPGTTTSSMIASPLLATNSNLNANGHNSGAFSLSRDGSLAMVSVAAGLMDPAPTSSAGAGIGGQNALNNQISPAVRYVIPAVVVAGGAIRGRMRGLYIPLDRFDGAEAFGVGDVHTPFGVAAPRSLAVLAACAHNTVLNNSSVARGFVERVLSWDASP